MDRRIERSPWKKRAPWLVAAAAAGLATVAYLIVAPGGGAKAVERASLEIAAAREAPFHDYLPARAQVAPLQTVYVDSVEGGRVERLVAQDGDLVKAGDLLAVLSNPELEREVGAQEADIAGRISDTRGQLLQVQRGGSDRVREVEQARFDLLRAEQNRQTRKSLHDKGFLSDAELKTVTEEASFRRERLTALQAAQRSESATLNRQSGEIAQTIARLQENLATVRRSLDSLQVRAPVDGRLTAFELQPGQTLTRGQRVGQVDTEGAYKLIAQVDEFYLGRVSVGQAATAQHEGERYRLRISRILPQVRDGRFQVEFAFEGAPPKAVRRGQNLDVEVTLGDTRQALLLPTGPFMEATGGAWVFVLDGERKAERRDIKIGRRNPQYVEVLSGLKPGDQVVTSTYENFQKQDRLVIR
jgi:HlyD family secretion protein